MALRNILPHLKYKYISLILKIQVLLLKAQIGKLMN